MKALNVLQDANMKADPRPQNILPDSFQQFAAIDKHESKKMEAAHDSSL
jgi:hypothetical protein